MKRDEYKDLPKGYYHLSTDGKWKGIIFHTPELYAYGMILMGLVTLHYAVDIYAFTLMENHIHIVLSGTGSIAGKFFTTWSKDSMPGSEEKATRNSRRDIAVN